MGSICTARLSKEDGLLSEVSYCVHPRRDSKSSGAKKQGRSSGRKVTEEEKSIKPSHSRF